MTTVEKKTLICDVETNALTNYTKLWCAVTYCVETKELRTFRYTDKDHVSAFKGYISDATHWIGHNFISFDRHVIRHFTGLPLIPLKLITDTLVRSRLFNSGRDGGHSLERWGAYFHIPKVGADYTDWETYDPIIPKRCEFDVAITRKLWKYQKQEGRSISQFAIDLESRFVELCDNMRERGFPIDQDIFNKKRMALASRHAQLEYEIKDAFPDRPRFIAEVTPKLNKDGKPYKNTKGFKYIKNTLNVTGPFSLIRWEEFNPHSTKQVRERMYEFGWKPVEFTKPSNTFPEGQAKVSEANLRTLPETAPKAAHLISEYLRLSIRLGLMDNWADNLGPDDKVHGDVIHIGAITHRCSHNNPNTANIPGNDEWNIRDCWAVSRTGDRRLVGVDAKGIQLRVLGHLTNDTEFIDQVVNGDPHAFNVTKIGPDFLPQDTDKQREASRKLAKRFIYAWLLGAGAKKVGLIFGTTAKRGKELGKRYLDSFESLGRVKGYMRTCAERGWFPAPDGRYIPIKSEHFALSVALQGIESIVMKLAGLLFNKDKGDMDAHLIAFVHDEYVIDAHKDCAQAAGELMSRCIGRAGDILKLRCPMEGDAPKIGYSWAEIH